MKKKTQIGEKFHFHLQSENITLVDEAIAYYNTHDLKDNDEWLYDEKTGLPIFLDTNILLDLYRTSTRRRNEFLKFMSQNKRRIYITGQVSSEFLRHRVSIIKTAESLLNRMKGDIIGLIERVETEQKSSIQKIDEWNKKRGLESDLSANVRDKINEILNCVKNAYNEEFQKAIEETISAIETDVASIKENMASEWNDSILSQFTNVNLLNKLSSQEIEFIQELYLELWDKAEKYQGDNENNEYFAFPGRGDHKKLEDGQDPSGDLIIYHEMLKFISEHDTDAIFLTGDVTKKDWLKDDGNPYGHYIIDNFANTKHIIHIWDYRRCNFDIRPLETDAQIEEKPLLKELSDTSNPIQKEEKTSFENAETDEKDDKIYSLASDDSIIDNIRYTPYIKITEQQFIDELKRSLRWATSYGNGSISVNFFIRDILAHKGFDLKTCYLTKDNLLKSAKIRISSTTKDGHRFDAISLNETSVDN